MSETDKNKEQNLKDTSPPKKREEKKKDIQSVTVRKKESHRDNNCILRGIDLGRAIDFNKMNPISVSIEELKINGAKFNDEGEIGLHPLSLAGG